MRTSRFFFEGPLEIQDEVSLPLETSHYLLQVLRLKVGSPLILFNDTGREYSASLVSVDKKVATVLILDSWERNRESPLYIHLAQAISRNEKMDLVIQKAVELGVAKITPLITDYSKVKLSEERLEKKISHWNKIVISACEQSGRTKVPLVSAAYYFEDWVQVAHTQLKLICDPKASRSIKSLNPTKSVTLVIGPEGGLSSKEITLTQQYNFLGISLGPRILRTETAAFAALSLLQGHFGDL